MTLQLERSYSCRKTMSHNWHVLLVRVDMSQRLRVGKVRAKARVGDSQPVV